MWQGLSRESIKDFKKVLLSPQVLVFRSLLHAPATPEVVSEVSPVLHYNQFLSVLQERYSSLRTEEVKEDQEVWAKL